MTLIMQNFVVASDVASSDPKGGLHLREMKHNSLFKDPRAGVKKVVRDQTGRYVTRNLPVWRSVPVIAPSCPRRRRMYHIICTNSSA